ncbi:MAG: type III-A CRISPR-associated RAMP protein Csm3, partial [Bryobacteraceae bacterium]|nr:type III-A CRISPR-associated RAMP protein Csm3 [Bryobacteraceae bacterium]
DDTLGGGGSRGSGRVRFDSLRLSWRGRSYYAAGAPEKELLSGADLAAVQSLVSKPEFASELAE